ncbi:hypothetical protein CC78DRAFT_529831 [Lojkania enalia]|uniref:Elongin-A n=1 Tax=Lojkania enalia TaxID=147567 RepID=A0A9P4KI99_9PLEO|nr:hypothetical protein CC78DRAFT_529831 [Didymosphaeria enalia]
MPVPTLYTLAKTRLISNISMLTDIGDLPYTFLAPILKHIQNPSQLQELETNCPQIVGETGEIWLRFIKRDIPQWDKKPHQPRDSRNWGKVYRKLKREAEQEKAVQEEQLKEQMKALQQNREGNQTKIVEARTGYDPSARRRGFGFRSGGGGGSSSWGNPAAPPKTGKMAFDKLRRSMFDQKQARPRATQMPTHLLNERKTLVKQAPERMIRMQDNTAPQKMLVSRRASQGAGSPSLPRPNITARPSLAQISTSPPSKPERASLPPGQHFSAPKIQPQQSGAGLKRKKAEVDPFMPKKKKA